jgi:hypothetical protein
VASQTGLKSECRHVDHLDVDVGGCVGAAWRAAVAGVAAVLTACLFVLAINDHWFGIGGGADTFHGGLDDLGEVLLMLALLPVAVVIVGLIVARVLRVPHWVTVGLLSPVVSVLVLSAPLLRWPGLSPVIAVAVYAALGAVSTNRPDRARAEG